MPFFCACVGKPSTRYETELEVAHPQTVTHNLDAQQQVPDAPPAGAAALTGRIAAKAAADQANTKDTCAAVDRSPRKVSAASTPRPADAPTSIWEKLASHEIRSISPTPEPHSGSPTTQDDADGVRRSTQLASEPMQHVAPLLDMAHSTPVTAKLNMERSGELAPVASAPVPAVAAAAKTPPSAAAKKAWGARTPPSAAGLVGQHSLNSHSFNSHSTPPRRLSTPGTPPSAGMSSSVLRPTAASAARKQATSKPKGEGAVWKH